MNAVAVDLADVEVLFHFGDVGGFDAVCVGARGQMRFVPMLKIRSGGRNRQATPHTLPSFGAG